MDEINDIIEIAKDAGLLTEVVYSALEAMKADDELTPEAAMVLGLEEWDT